MFNAIHTKEAINAVDLSVNYDLYLSPLNLVISTLTSETAKKQILIGTDPVEALKTADEEAFNEFDFYTRALLDIDGGSELAKIFLLQYMSYLPAPQMAQVLE